MTTLDYALTSVERLKGFLLDKQRGKTVPSILIRTELALLVKRIDQMGEPETPVFDLTAFRNAREADEVPEAVSGVAEDDA